MSCLINVLNNHIPQLAIKHNTFFIFFLALSGSAAGVFINGRIRATALRFLRLVDFLLSHLESKSMKYTYQLFFETFMSFFLGIFYES